MFLNRTMNLQLFDTFIMWVQVLVIFILIDFTEAFREDKSYWLKDGRDGIQYAWKLRPNYSLAKNIILMVGDGMGISTVTAGRIYQGQKKGQSGEEYKLTFEQFPYLALAKTYSVDRQVPDSASTAVSMVTGVKVNFGTLGVNNNVLFGKDCKNVTDSNILKTVLHYALEEGKSVGIVTTTRVTHATPAAMFARSPHRDWECDADMTGATNCDHVKDIAYQLIMDNPDIQVILGGGRQYFTNISTPDPMSSTVLGIRKDGLDLIQAWTKDKKRRGLRHQYIYNRQQLNSVDPVNTDYLLGLVAPNHNTYEALRDTTTDEPTLSEMTEKAIRILSKNNKGYFLLIEGGKIDHGHHENGAKKALEELAEFDNAVAKVTTLTSSDDTLTVVTADHSHVFTIAGYPSRGSNILGVADHIDVLDTPDDKMPYTTLGYLNGPFVGRTNLTGVDTTASSFRQTGCIKMPLETHAGEDVPVYAAGPMSHLFQGTREQSYIGHVLMYAACLGDYKNNCDMNQRNSMETHDIPCSAVTPVLSLALVLVSMIFGAVYTFPC